MGSNKTARPRAGATVHARVPTIFEASLADIQVGGQGNDAPSRCVPFAMPRVMTVVFDMEIVITSGTTYMLSAMSAVTV
jgi:hypothetical protein